MHLPARFAAVILAFTPVFLQQRTWRRAELLLIGAILAPGKRTVTSLLRIVGLSRERRFTNYHRILNRAVWPPRVAARLLLGLLVDAFAPNGPVLLGIDDTIERRRGKRIAANCREHGRRHKKLTDRARQMALQARRWLPGREIVLLGDSSFAALELLVTLARHGLIGITRLRLDAALYKPAPPRRPGTVGRPRTKGARLPNLSEVLVNEATCWRRVVVPAWYGERDRVVEISSATAVWRHAGLPVLPIRWVLLRDPQHRFDPQALLCTDPTCDPLQIVHWFVQRWQVEVTFREVRDHLGVETQRQWSDLAIARTTPCLLGLFSIVTLLAARLGPQACLAVATAAWYRKTRPTFADTLAAVRRHMWADHGFLTSHHAAETTKPPPGLRKGITYALCHAA